MQSITAFRRRDGTYTLQVEPNAVPVTLALIEGVSVRRTNIGELRMFREDEVYGVAVEVALRLGWCWPP